MKTQYYQKADASIVRIITRYKYIHQEMTFINVYFYKISCNKNAWKYTLIEADMTTELVRDILEGCNCKSCLLRVKEVF